MKKGNKFVKWVLAITVGIILSVKSADALDFGSSGIATFTKNSFVAESVKTTVPYPNVLFLLDTGAQMTMTTDGVLPLATDSNSESTRRSMLTNYCTFGVGVRTTNDAPPSITPNDKGGIGGLQLNIYRRGIDKDSGNNTSSAYNYYSSTAQTLSIVKNAKDNNKFDPKLTSSTIDLSTDYIHNGLNTWIYRKMPNDSRLYKMKLALWRLFYPETDPATSSTTLKNQCLEKLASMRIGVATTYNEQYYPTDEYVGQLISAYHFGGYAMNRKAYRMPISGGDDITSTSLPLKVGASDALKWVLGSGGKASYIDNNYTNTTAYPNSYYFVYTRGLDTGLYDNYASGSTNWRRVNRAILEIPFGMFYYKSTPTSTTYYSTNFLKGFSKFINGVESQYYMVLPGTGYGSWSNKRGYVVETSYFGLWDPELVPAGRSNIATSLYARDYAEKLSMSRTFGITGHTPSLPAYDTSYIHYWGTGNSASSGWVAYAVTYKGGWGLYFPGFIDDNSNYQTTSAYTYFDTTNYSSVVSMGLKPTPYVTGFFTPDFTYRTSVKPSAYGGVGSAIDFFSPHTGVSFSTDNAGYFPIQSKCQKNYVVLFTAGDNELTGNFSTSAGMLSGTHIRTAPEAALALFKASYKQNLRGYNLNSTGSTISAANYTMDDGIRTLVVGLVDSTSSNVAALRDQLNHIAQYGDPRWDADAVDPDTGTKGAWVPDESKKAIFLAKGSNGMAQFIDDIRSQVIGRIYNEFISEQSVNQPIPPYLTGAKSIIRMEKVNEGEEENAVKTGKIFTAQYKSNEDDQWIATFDCFEILCSEDETIKSDDGSIWNNEAGAQMANKGSGRRVYTSRGKQNTTDTSLIQLKSDNFTTSEVIQLLDMTEYSTTKVKSLMDWVFNPTNISNSEITPLGDMEHSNFLYVERGDEDDTIYLQTNRGMLHEINARTGEENWAFIPPNVFQGRLKYLKNSSELKEGQKSVPLYLLDGKISTEMVNGKRILIGTLRYGGAGMYALDISNQSDPKFLWAVENVWDVNSNTSKGILRWGDAMTGNSGDYGGYSSLGLTTQDVTIFQLPDVAHTGENAYVGILPGGVAFNMNTPNGQGNGVFVINPENGAILSKINTMGQMVAAPLTFVISTSSANKLEGVYRGM